MVPLLLVPELSVRFSVVRDRPDSRAVVDPDVPGVWTWGREMRTALSPDWAPLLRTVPPTAFPRLSATRPSLRSPVSRWLG